MSSVTNIQLESDGLDRAATQLARAMEKFDPDSFQIACRVFATSVDKFQTLLAMRAENERRSSQGLAQAYDEKAFHDV